MRIKIDDFLRRIFLGTYFVLLVIPSYLIRFDPVRKMETNVYQQINQSTDNSVYIEMDLLQVGSEPVGMRCPFCTEDIMTKATYTNTSMTHLIAIVLGILFWWLCCCIVPYFTKRFKNVEHYCPNCHRFLGVYARKSCLRRTA